MMFWMHFEPRWKSMTALGWHRNNSCLNILNWHLIQSSSSHSLPLSYHNVSHQELTDTQKAQVFPPEEEVVLGISAPQARFADATPRKPPSLCRRENSFTSWDCKRSSGLNESVQEYDKAWQTGIFSTSFFYANNFLCTQSSILSHNIRFYLESLEDLST